DDLSSGIKSNIQHDVDAGGVELLHGALRDASVADRATRGVDVVFHLAADHGGRGYVDLHQYDCSTNLGLDALLMRSILDNEVGQVVYASSGCIYPLYIQTDPNEIFYLTEDKARPPYDPDAMYGLAKLAEALTLKALHT